MEKFCPPTNAVPGSLLVFSGYVSNCGSLTLTNVQVVNNQPAPLTPVTNFSVLAPGAVRTFGGSYSSLSFRVQTNKTYWVAADDVGAATGVVHLNYNFVTPSRLTPLGVDLLGHYRLRVSGRADMKFKIQSSLDFKSWLDLMTITSPGKTFDFTDLGSGGDTVRFYRAEMLP